MRALVLGLVLFVLACYIPSVAAQELNYGIMNPNTCPELVNYTTTSTYVCVVKWYAQLPMNARVVISLIDTQSGKLLDYEEYDVSANLRVEETTTLTTSVPTFHTVLHLIVEMKVFDYMTIGPESYNLPVEVVPEFPAVWPMLLVLLIPAMAASTRKRAPRCSAL
jgi:hypothetical protein